MRCITKVNRFTAFTGACGITLALMGCVGEGSGSDPETANDTTDPRSPYAGEQTREISSLTSGDVESLKQGTGVAFGGMARPAELNSYPGPRHVLDLADSLELSAAQRDRIQEVHDAMKVDALEIGAEVLDTEQKIDALFASQDATDTKLEELVTKSGELRGALRLVHLSAHLRTVEILSDDQVDRYDQLRGYTSGEACESVPEGHSPERWRMHHGCD